jgi:hypothetical protein
MTSEKATSKNISASFNRWLYGGFVLMSIYFLFRGDFMTAASNLGIALIFDPFDQTIKWENRKTYQRVWLFVHFAITAVLFITGFLK